MYVRDTGSMRDMFPLTLQTKWKVCNRYTYQNLQILIYLEKVLGIERVTNSIVRNQHYSTSITFNNIFQMILQLFL